MYSDGVVDVRENTAKYLIISSFKLSDFVAKRKLSAFVVRALSLVSSLLISTTIRVIPFCILPLDAVAA